MRYGTGKTGKIVFNAHKHTPFTPFVQIPHRIPGFWLSDPICGSGHQGHSGVSGSQVERSDD